MTTLVFMLAALLIGVAIVRRPEPATWVLAALFAASVPAGSMFGHDRIIPVLAFIDGCLVVAMAAIWTRSHCQRARIIGTIGLAKVAWALTAVSFSHVNYYSYASALNGAFLLQIVIAGGFVDAVGTWCADLHRRFIGLLLGRFRHVVR